MGTNARNGVGQARADGGHGVIIDHRFRTDLY